MTQVGEAERIIKLMLFIRENGPVDLASIRRALPYEYGIHAGSEDSTRRRFERDKKTLQAAGVFLTIDDRQRYALDTRLTHAAPLNLSKPQVSLLRMLCGALLDDEEYPFKEELRMVLVKLGDELETPDMLPQLAAATKTANSPTQTAFSKVKRAISMRKRLSFTYTRADGATDGRTVEPFGCFFLHGICYVVAFDPQAQSTRCFRLDRMTKLHVNANNPKSPDFDERPFDVTEYSGLPFQFGAEDYMAQLVFDETAAHNAYQLSMGHGELAWRDGELIWNVRVRSTRELARWCIEHGPGIRILSPKSAHQAYVDGIRAYLEGVDGEVTRS